jgi:hypothetical protein
MQQRHRMRLALAQGIPADHAREPLAQAELLEERVGEPSGLVGDDAEGEAPRGKLGEHRIHSGKEPRPSAERGAVDLEIAALQSGQPLHI